jgi:two-component system CheB/CheR fusion protein
MGAMGSADRMLQRHGTFLAWLGLAVVFGLDLTMPQGYAVPLLYVPVILLGMVTHAPRLALQLAAAATTLTMIEWGISPHEGNLGAAIFNRTVAVVVMWITATGVATHRHGAARRQVSLRDLEDIRQALDQSAIVATTDVPGRIRFVNDKFCEISGYSREELIGQDHRVLNSGFHSKEFIRELWRTIAQGGVWRGEIRNRAKDGSIYWVDTTIVPFLDARSKPWQYMAIRYDITARKAQEVRLRDQAALAALGEFAAVVAHEVRNPLAGVRNGVQLITSELPAASDGIALGGEIVARIDALNRVIEDLLTFARPRVFSPAIMHLSTFVSDVVGGFKLDPAMQGIEVEIRGETNTTIEADVDQLRLVFTNLLVNAGQSMSGTGRIELSIERDGEHHCVVAVSDRGSGIPDGLQEKIFDPFFTTKHRGTGLGLPTVKRVVEAHHGTVELVVRDGGGAVARVTLPLRQPVRQPV